MLATVVLIAILVPSGPLGLDRSWSEAMHHLETPLLTHLALVFNWLGRGLGRAVALTLVGLLLLRRRRWLALVAFAVAESLAPLLSTLLKVLVDRARPPDGLVHPVGASFPSGHATYAGATCVALVLLFTTPGTRRRWWWALASLGVVGMAWSRTYLQVHWLTDVIAGALLGSGVSLLVFAIAQRHESWVVDRVLGRRDFQPLLQPAGELAAAGRIGDPAGMAKTYRLSPGTRLINSLFRALTRLGLGASYRHILTVPGRKTGRLYSTPVDIIELDDQRWLVAGYGPTNWVRNVRAAGEVTLSRGRRSERFRVEEADRPAAVPVLRTYMREIRVTRPYFDASPDSADEEVAAELARHSVFRLIPVVNGGRQTDAAT